eukprot:scaffold10240_cov107-Isochrysis_galbana.AAC.7
MGGLRLVGAIGIGTRTRLQLQTNQAASAGEVESTRSSRCALRWDDGVVVEAAIRPRMVCALKQERPRQVKRAVTCLPPTCVYTCRHRGQMGKLSEWGGQCRMLPALGCHRAGLGPRFATRPTSSTWRLPGKRGGGRDSRWDVSPAARA